MGSEMCIRDRHYVKEFNDGVKRLLEIAPTVNSVNDLESEDDVLEFVQAFRELIRVMNVLKTFSEFTFNDLYMEAQAFEDYKSKYLDIYDRTRNPSEAASIVNDVDFELELIHRDEINVSYILKLLAQLHKQADDPAKSADADATKQSITDLLSTEIQLRSKRELIERFINESMPSLPPNADIPEEFNAFWDTAKQSAFDDLCKKEDLDPDRIHLMIDNYNFTGREPLRDDVVASLKTKPKILDRANVIDRVTQLLVDFVKTFDDNLGDV